jgi:hypothetical protein
MHQLLEAVPETHIAKRHDARMGFSNVSCLGILTHLRTTYGIVTPEDLKRVRVRVRVPCLAGKGSISITPRRSSICLLCCTIPCLLLVLLVLKVVVAQSN